MSTRQIARDFGLSETAIRKKARAECWLRRDVAEDGVSAIRSHLGEGIVGQHRHDRPRVGKPIYQLRRELPAVEPGQSRKVSAQDLIEASIEVAEDLLCAIREDIDKRERLIKIIEAAEQPSVKLSRQYRLLLKEFDVKNLSAALYNVKRVIEDITWLERKRMN